ncbi:MAG: DUF481 domain-containing protein [Akkermansiaceae bacterium]|nr:DUF481 domain-containing protein [Verrucomicrobiales bacterium]
MPRLRSLDCFYRFKVLVAGLLVCAGAAAPASAQKVRLRLASGDLIYGTILSETTTRLVLSNSWNAELSVPLQQIVSRATNVPPVTTGLASTETVLFGEAKPRSESSVTTKTNGWKGEAQVGLDLLYGAKERQIFHGRFKLGYQEPYASDPKKFFRNTFEYGIDYGTTTSERTTVGGTSRVTEKTSDRMQASDKTSFDLINRWYVYSLVGGGYDHILKINAQYEAGPGLGYHLITRTNVTMNLEGGLNYQAQFREEGSELQDVYYRLAEDITWKIWGRLSLVEKLEFFPRVNLTGYRMRFESTLKYDLWKNLSLNLTVLDMYDTQPAEDVSQNELQIRSSVGVKF